jgi:hypothetical protein
MPDNKREEQFERALVRHLRDASPDSACPDVETLAAYHERTLSLKEMTRVKEHIAGCARCQEALALVEQSEGVHAEEGETQRAPVPVENLVSPRRKAATSIRATAKRPPWRWIVPVGALAASVIVWIGAREIQKQRSQVSESVQVAQNRRAAPEAPAADYKATDQLKREEPPSQKLVEATPTRNATPSPPSKAPASTQMVAVDKEKLPPPPASVPAVNNQGNVGVSGGANVVPPPPAPPQPSSGVAAKSSALQRAAPAAAANAPAEARNRLAEEKKKAPVPSATETVEVTAAAPAVDATASSTQALSPRSTQLTVESRNVASLLRFAAADPHYIVAPGEKHAWRVGEAGKIERSTDDGKTWKPQKSGVAADLTAGSATSDKVCWVIGKAGTVMLTTDGGKHWKQIPSPISEDLGGIHATDARHASLWDVPNRKSFETSDGGATWNRISKN